MTVDADVALAADNATTREAAPQDPEARARLLDMAGFISGAKAFGVTIRSGYDAIQEDGQRIEFGEKRKITLRRPDHIRVEAERSDGDRGLILFDGKVLTAFKADDNLFAQQDRNSTVDEMLVYMVRDLRLTMPLARMFHTGFRDSLEKLLTSVSFVEENYLFDVPTDHLAVRSDSVDLQVWVSRGEQPLPRRVVITYKNEPGQPQFWAELSDWNFSPAVTEANFSFTPPPGAEKIPLLAPARKKGALPMQEGGAQ
jgi:hypothetical protein